VRTVTDTCGDTLLDCLPDALAERPTLIETRSRLQIQCPAAILVMLLMLPPHLQLSMAPCSRASGTRMEYVSRLNQWCFVHGLYPSSYLG